jgi:integrase
MRPLLQGLSTLRKHVFLRNNTYYYRSDVPSDLAHYFPRAEVKLSLKTSDPDAAKLAALSLELQVQQAYALLRLGRLTDEIVKQLVATVMPDTPNATVLENKGRLLTNIITTYTLEKKSGWTGKTTLEVAGVFKLLVDIMGDIDVSTITRPMLIQLRAALLRVPPNFYKKNPGKSVKAAIAANTEAGISIKSVNKHVARIGSLLKYCHELGYITNNPATGLQLSEKQRVDEERSVYSHDDIKSIVSNLPPATERPERYWIPLIGLYSGMRLAEICQLYVDDIIKVDGCWCFNINNSCDKQLKNDASVRVIPVHPKLIELGLIKYVESMRDAGQPRLWMNLSYIRLHGYTNTFGKWYQRYNRDYVTEDPKKVFHSMRHLVADTLKQRGVSEVVISELVGHAHKSITSSRYGKRYQPKVLLEALELLDYGIDMLQVDKRHDSCVR